MSNARINLPGNESVAIDEKGYLLDWQAWTPEVARAMAVADSVELEDDHWAILTFFRAYFEKYEIEPPMRALVRQVREILGEEKGNSRYLYRLFPDGPGTQACRYAGLPRPVSCL
jgi:TusE/DsrC/DsvC family sulfur relay protein